MQFKIGANIENASIYNVVKSIEEELDYGSLVIPFSTRANQYQPFTLVDITLDDLSHEYWYVDSSKVVPVDIKERTKYRHEITIIELTKWLERFPIPSRAFVQLSTGTPFTLLDVVNNLIETTPFDDKFNVTGTRIIDSVDATLQTKLTRTSPDIFLTDRTLKEAFVEVFKIINAYPRLTTNEDGDMILSADYYDEVASLVDMDSNISYKENLQQSSKYATAFNVVGSNMIYSYDKTASSIIEPTPTGWIGMRSDSGVLSVDDCKVKLNEGIEELIKVEVKFALNSTKSKFVPIGESGSTTYELDITEWIVESEIRKTLPKDTYKNDIAPTTIIDLYKGKYQANTAYWTQGQKEITGFFDQVHPNVLGNTKSSMLYLLSTAYFQDTGSSTLPDTEPNPQYIQWRVQYVPKITARQHVERTDLTEFATGSTLIFGQSDSFLASDRALDSMFSRLNRTGMTEVTTSVFNATQTYPIGSYTTDGYVMVSSERLMYPDHYDMKYKWTKDYSKVSDFLGLNSEPKLFEIQSTLVRNEIFKQYLIIDTVSVTDNSYLSGVAKHTLINTLKPTPSAVYNKPIYAAVFTSDDMSVEGVYKPVVSYAGGNTLNFFIGFDNPISAGLRTIPEVEGNDNPYDSNEAVYYTDSDGRLTDFTVAMDNDLTVDADALPVVSKPDTPMIDCRGFRTRKNQAEILALTYQTIVTPQQGLNVIVGDKFLKDNNLISDHSDGFDTLYIYVSNTDFKDNKSVGNAVQTARSWSMSGYAYLETILPITDYKNWALGNGDGDLYIAVNQTQVGEVVTPIQRIYFNFRNDRQDSTYLPPVAAPINLVSTQGQNNIFFDWDDAQTSDQFNYKIEKNGVTVANGYTTATYYDFTGLTRDTEYKMSVRAELGGVWSSWVSLTDKTDYGSPDAPTFLTTEVLGMNSISITWENVVGEDGYTTQVSTDGISWAYSYNHAINETEFSYDMLSAGIGYYFRVKALGKDSYADSAWYTTSVKVYTVEPPTTENPLLNISDVTESTITMRVTNPMINGEDVRMYYGLDTNPPTLLYPFYIPAGDSVTYQFTGLQTRLEYHVYTYTISDDWLPSDILESDSVLLEPTTSPDAPSSLTISGSGGVNMLLTIGGTTGILNEDGFEIEIFTASGYDPSNYYDEGTYYVPRNLTSLFLESPAPPAGTYWARVRSYNTVGKSYWVYATPTTI